jgi:biofilm PGA synthesis protein PgaA
MPNWPKAELKLAKGWLLLYEDRLNEAETHFSDLHEKAPANTNFRTGLAYTYLWRGWPRRALREFNISRSMDEQDINARIGEISALNTLAFKEQAREEAGNLLKAYPKNRHVQSLVRQLEVEEKREISADILVSSDDDGVSDVQTGLRLTWPVSLYTNVYGLLFYQRTESLREGLVSYFRRAGLGADHIFNSSWKLRQQFSFNYDNAGDFGSLTEIMFTPDDHWGFGLSYDSFTTDVPLRARVFDIEADNFKADITWRESEWRSFRISHSRIKFSDDNRRLAGQFGYEQGLYVKNDWKMRLFLDLATSSNSSDDAPYFNPERDFGLSVTHMTEHTIKRIYRKAFLQRLYLSLGTYKQSGFSYYATGSARYEHDMDFSDVHALLYGISLGRQVFDGEAVTGWSFYLTWRLLF